MVRTIVGALLALALFAGPAAAVGPYLAQRFYVEDLMGQPLDFSFTQVEANTLQINLVNADSVLAKTGKFALTKPCVWFNADFESETYAKNAWLRFKTPDTGNHGATSVANYSWESWIPVILNGDTKARSFNVAGPESVHVKVFGSADGIIQLGWWTEAVE
ncbi:MAG: hypothetical protein ABII82_13895 [Verrucomicrobiota bacterium]